MNEIEAKRKELIKDCIDWYHTKNGAVSTKDCFEYAIKITDEMARKEILDKVLEITNTCEDVFKNDIEKVWFETKVKEFLEEKK